ncbi:MAG: V-type ATP synthase subunit B [Nitrospira sp. LK70]|nr:V-type ATP synthase subunit B [Nitrospira sp. LK70]
MDDLITREYRSVSGIAGPLLFVERLKQASLGERVEIMAPNGEARRGQVIELSEQHAVIQVLEETTGLGVTGTRVRLTESAATMDLSPDLLGRRFSGVAVPLDGLPPIIPDVRMDIIGQPMNPVSRDKPSHFIQTGISTIDALNTLVRGQKLPIFSGAGLPAKEVAAQIVRQAKVREGDSPPSSRGLSPSHGPFTIVFAAMGITFREASFFLSEFDRGGVMEHAVLFLNLADDPTIERLLTPRYALTAAEYLAFTLGRQVLVILTDMAAYCEALRQIATAREEIPGRRGYPGYMYSDLASIYERAGRIKGRAGSITQLPIVTMPDDDMTHPIPDLTGYITEGQIVLSRELHRKGIFPPIDVLPCLSRLMNLGIGPGKTREDHRSVADQLYAFYAHGRDIRRLAAIVGEDGLSEADRLFLKFSQDFEQDFVNQGSQNREMEETLDLGWKFLGYQPKERLTRVKPELIEKYYGQDVKREPLNGKPD